MENETKALEEASKATQEIAKTTGKFIDATSELGSFVSQYIGGPLEQAMGLVQDKLAYMQWERQARYIRKSNELIRELGLMGRIRPVQMKLAIPILQAASLEEDDELQDIWVRLLANAANPDFEYEITPAFINILNNFGPLEAKILEKVNSSESSEFFGVPIAGLPDFIHDEYAGFHDGPSEDAKVAIWNLIRLGCLEDVDRLSSKVKITQLGKALFRACSLPSKQTAPPVSND